MNDLLLSGVPRDLFSPVGLGWCFLALQEPGLLWETLRTNCCKTGLVLTYGEGAGGLLAF